MRLIISSWTQKHSADDKMCSLVEADSQDGGTYTILFLSYFFRKSDSVTQKLKSTFNTSKIDR